MPCSLEAIIKSVAPMIMLSNEVLLRVFSTCLPYPLMPWNVHVAYTFVVSKYASWICFQPYSAFHCLRIYYDLQSCLDDCHWSRCYMEIFSNHVLLCLIFTLMPCFCLPWSCTVASLFHASNMSICYSCSHVCSIFH